MMKIEAELKQSARRSASVWKKKRTFVLKSIENRAAMEYN